jgi:ribosomal protein L37AE/L43A
MKQATDPQMPKTGRFWCEKCGHNTLHRMDADGWKKGACLMCEFKAAQLPLFSDRKKDS